MKIHVITGSTRPGRMSERVAKWVAAEAAKLESVEVELVDLTEYPLDFFNEPIPPQFNPNREPNHATQKWITKLAEADGYVIVTPEYNHSFPGVLKNAIDYVDFQFAKKPIALVSYGVVGGARAAEHLRGSLATLKAVVIPESLTLMSPASLFTEDGVFTGDVNEAYGPAAGLGNVLNDLVWYAQTLADGRAKA